MNDIDSQSVLYSNGSNDECLTPGYAVTPILKYIPRDAKVWCPFDKEDSQFVRQIGQWQKDIKGGYTIFTHIEYGQNFYEFEPVNSDWDIMISNPPFTNKRGIFERALSFNKPFALIMSNTWLNDAAPKQLFMEKELQLLMFDKRIRFISPDGRRNDKITFSSSYYCWNFLPKQIIMEKLIID